MRTQSTPTCPRCGSDTEVRKNQWGEFYGCVEYPECRGLVPVEPRRMPRRQAVERQARRDRQLTPEDADLLGVLPRDRFTAAMQAVLDLLAKIEAEVMAGRSV